MEEKESQRHFGIHISEAILSTRYIVGSGQLESESKPAAGHLRNILLCLDTSASMNGKPIQTAKLAVANLTQSLHESAEIILLLYNSKAQIIQANPKIIRTQLLKIQPSGGTDFLKAFETIPSATQKFSKKGLPLVVIFFTDGCDTSLNSAQNIKSKYSEVFSLLFNSNPSLQVHCLGFSPEHDIGLLSHMANFSLNGVSNGTFQLVDKPEDFQEALEILFPNFQEHVVDVSVTRSSGEGAGELIEAKFNEKTKEISFTFKLSQTAPEIKKPETEKNEEKLFLKVMKGEQKLFETCFVLSCLGPVSPSELFKLLHEQISAKLIQLVSVQLGNPRELSKEELNSLLNEYKELHSAINQLQKAVFTRDKREIRKENIGKFYFLKDQLKSFWSLFKSKSHEAIAKNERLQKLTSIAFQGRIKGSVQKKLNERISRNLLRFENFFSQIDRIKNEEVVPFLHEIEEKTKSIGDSIGFCFFTGSSIYQLMEEGDAICICLHVSRSEAAISEPSQLEILEISPSKMGASVFQDAYEMALLRRDHENVHGGFSRSGGTVLKGMAREAINSVFPLFICPEHWKLAKEWLKVSLSLAVTLDPLGFNAVQMNTIPFKLLWKCIELKYHQASGAQSVIYGEVLKVCQEILKENKDLMSSATEILENLVNGKGEKRFPNFIQSFQVFFGQIHASQELGVVLKIKKWQGSYLMRILGEEVLRRKFVKSKMKGSIEEFSFFVYESKLNELEKSNYFSKKLRFFEKLGKNVQRERLFSGFEANSKVFEEEKMESKEKSKSSKWGSELLSKSGKELVAKIYKWAKTTQMTQQILEGVKIISETPKETPTNSLIEVLPCQNSPSGIAFALFIGLNPTAAQREADMSNSKFPNLFDETEAEIWLSSLFKKNQDKHELKMVSEKTKGRSTLETQKDVRSFVNAKTIEEAACSLYGAIIGINIGLFFDGLVGEVCELALEKYKLLLDGYFSTVMLLHDKRTKRPETPPLWLPSKNRNFQFWKKYKEVYGNQKLKEFFQENNLRHAVDQWVKRVK